MIWLWCTRAHWALLPVTTGTALGDALDGWSTGPARVAAVLLWAAWVGRIVRTVRAATVGTHRVARRRARRPCSSRRCRSQRPTVVGAALALASAASPQRSRCRRRSRQAAGNALAYGDELRFPLRIPLPLLLGPIPLAVAARRPRRARPVRCSSPTGATSRGVAAHDRRRSRSPRCSPRSLHPLSCAGSCSFPPASRRRSAHAHRTGARAPRADRTASAHGATALGARRARPPARHARPATFAIDAARPRRFGRRRGRHDAEIVDADVALVSRSRTDALVRDGRRPPHRRRLNRRHVGSATMPPPQHTSPS